VGALASKRGTKAEEAVAAPEPTPQEAASEPEDHVYSTRWYWTVFWISLGVLILEYFYFDPSMPPSFIYLGYLTVFLAVALMVITGVLLVRRYNVARRVIESARGLANRPQEARTAQKKPSSDAMAKAARRVGGWIRSLALFVLGVIRFVYRTVLRIVYLIELIVIWTLILTYDIIYAVLYAAWWLSYHVLRIAGKLARVALKIVWKVVRILTRLPGARKSWDESLMPKIMGWWNGMVAERRRRWATRIERQKRIQTAKGHDADVWLREKVERHWFPLPQPHVAKDALKKRLVTAQETKDRRVEEGLRLKTPQERRELKAQRLATRQAQREEREKHKAEEAAAREQARREKEAEKARRLLDKRKGRSREREEETRAADEAAMDAKREAKEAARRQKAEEKARRKAEKKQAKAE
jgi:hypothetical protein